MKKGLLHLDFFLVQQPLFLYNNLTLQFGINA